MWLLATTIVGVIFGLIPGDAKKIEGGVPLQNFPPSIEVNYASWENWARDLKSRNWIASPRNAGQVVELSNWARKHSYQLRPSGFRRSFSPLTAQPSDHNKGVVIVDSTEYMTGMGVSKGDSTFWAEPGIKLERVLEQLEEAELGLGAFPAIGEISLGGALASGSHGVGLPSTKVEGHGYGTLANLIVSFTAVVYDPRNDTYALKEFSRSNPEASAFLTNFGRYFLTNITLRAGPLIRLHCETREVKAQDLFSAEVTKGSYVDFLNNGLDRLEIFYLPLFKDTITFYGSRLAERKPPGAREVVKPYSYGNIILPGKLSIWGTIKNILLFVKPNVPRVSVAGWAIITSRANIQPVLHKFYSHFKLVAEEHRAKYSLPFVVSELRVTALDDPSDVGVPGAQSPGFSSLSPIDGRPDLDVAVFIEIVGHCNFKEKDAAPILRFMLEIEAFLWNNFNNDESVVRVEWSKGWGFTLDGPYTNASFIQNLKDQGMFSKWGRAVRILESYDPYKVFGSSFMDQVLEGTGSCSIPAEAPFAALNEADDGLLNPSRDCLLEPHSVN